MNTAVIIAIAYLLGVLTGIIINKFSYKDKIKFYEKKNEKLSQQKEIDSDDKKALERKVATLEIALENALKNKN